MARDLSMISWRKYFAKLGTQGTSKTCKYCQAEVSTDKEGLFHFYAEHSVVIQCPKCTVILDTKSMAVHKQERCNDDAVCRILSLSV